MSDMAQDRASKQRVAVAAARVLRDLNVDERRNELAEKVIRKYGKGTADGARSR